MMGRNISFKGAIGKIIPKLSLLPLLISSNGIVNYPNERTVWFYSVIICSKDETNRQTVQTLIRLEQSDLGLHCKQSSR